MDYLRTAAVVWPFPIALAGVLILKNESLEPLMQAVIGCLIVFVLLVAAFVVLSHYCADQPDLTHPD